ncbi:DUF1631 domain-containing protein [Proteobacteria bacterium 005FR1]|nr:DUF1631 domain-containing protein [Proteobacteria bacterium 005FR1]
MQSDGKNTGAKVVAINANSKADNSLSAQERAKLTKLPAPVHAVQERGKQLFSKSLRSLFDNADDALFALADKATSNQDQNLYFESMREVRIRRRELESSFADAIDAAFVDLVIKEGAHSRFGTERPEGLSLVKDDELEELVAIESMVSKANADCGESLQCLSLRLDSLVPNKVYQKTNPLGPDIVCNAFVGAARQLKADIKAKLVLFKLFDEYVVKQLPSIYEALNGILIEHNVLPSLKPQKQAQQQPASAGTFSEGQATTATPAGNALPAPELMVALSQIQSQETSGWDRSISSAAALQTDIINRLLKALENHHGKKALSQPQMETINLVKLLFEFILDDRNLADPMKALIGRLQIPILKVALLDESFFKKTGHPARRLLNEMATASLGWQANPESEGAPSDPLYLKISTVVHQLLSEFETDLSLFNDVLADFVSFVDRERRRASILEQRTIDAEGGMARAEAARETVREALERIIADRPVPQEVRKILDEAWSNVLFLICLKQGNQSEEWQQALQTADDLVWSVTSDARPESRQQLLGMIPHLVRRLREGLERISYNPFQMNQLFNQLEKLHLARLQARDAGAATEAASIGASPAPTPTTGSESTPVREPVDEQFLATVDKLTQGTWFEITEESGRSYRCRLAAIIKPTGKYIFVNRSGMKVAEQSRAGLAEALQANRLKPLDDSMLFDRALESVISGLRKPK